MIYQHALLCEILERFCCVVTFKAEKQQQAGWSFWHFRDEIVSLRFQNVGKRLFSDIPCAIPPGTGFCKFWRSNGLWWIRQVFQIKHWSLKNSHWIIWKAKQQFEVFIDFGCEPFFISAYKIQRFILVPFLDLDQFKMVETFSRDIFFLTHNQPVFL